MVSGRNRNGVRQELEQVSDRRRNTHHLESISTFGKSSINETKFHVILVSFKPVLSSMNFRHFFSLLIV